MSTAQPTGADPSPTETLSPNQNSGGGGTSYFFGFLITFVALLLIFVGCGLGSRRRMARRRALLLADGPWGMGLGGDVDQKEPVYWEPQLVKGGDTWDKIMPLSISVLPKAQDNRGSPTPAKSQNLGAFSLPSWFPGARRRSNSVSKHKQTPLDVPEAQPPESVELQMAVMISFPSANRQDPNLDTITNTANEYQLGVVQIPWERPRTVT